VERARNAPVPTWLVFSLGVLATVALAVSAWFLASTQADQRNDLRNRYSDRTQIAASLIDALFRVAFNGQAAQDAQRFGGARIDRARLDADARRGQLTYSMVIDASGKVLATAGRAPARPDGAALSQARRGAFGLSPVTSGRPAAVESVVGFDTPTGKRFLVNGTPLTVFRSFLDATIRPLPTLRRSRAFVLDGHGQALGVALSRGRPSAMPSPALLRAIKGRSSASYTTGGSRIFAAATPIPNTPWRVVSTANENDLYASVSGPRRWAPWAILVVGALALIAVAFLLWRLLITNHALVENRRMLELRAQELERSNADLEQFAYAASHDLSEPLRTVAGFSQLLRQRYQGQLDAEADEYLGHMGAGVERMQQLIDDLLLYSRVGREPAREEDVDLEDVLTTVLAWIAPTVEERDARVTHDRLPLVRGARGQIAQVLQNLVSNAIKFTDPDTVPEVHLWAERSGGFWRIAVRDNGIGVEGGTEVIFKMFGRLHGVDAYPGTGIGLALAKRIVEGHGGHIWVDSAPGRGSIFSFTLPAATGLPRTAAPVEVPAA
jgi:signal transduction histidine kinase